MMTDKLALGILFQVVLIVFAHLDVISPGRKLAQSTTVVLRSDFIPVGKNAAFRTELQFRLLFVCNLVHGLLSISFVSFMHIFRGL